MKYMVEAYVVIAHRGDERVPVLAHTDRYEAKFYAADKEHETGIIYTIEPAMILWGE